MRLGRVHNANKYAPTVGARDRINHPLAHVRDELRMQNLTLHETGLRHVALFAPVSQALTNEAPVDVLFSHAPRLAHSGA